MSAKQSTFADLIVEKRYSDSKYSGFIAGQQLGRRRRRRRRPGIHPNSPEGPSQGPDVRLS